MKRTFAITSPEPHEIQGTIRMTATPTGLEYWIQMNIYQGGRKVMSAFSQNLDGTEHEFTLGPTPLWPGGDAVGEFQFWTTKGPFKPWGQPSGPFVVSDPA